MHMFSLYTNKQKWTTSVFRKTSEEDDSILSQTLSQNAVIHREYISMKTSSSSFFFNLFIFCVLFILFFVIGIYIYTTMMSSKPESLQHKDWDAESLRYHQFITNSNFNA